MIHDCVIMAGGSGTRLWPASNSKKPKQFLAIGHADGKTFFSTSLERALALIDKKDGRVIIVAGKSHTSHIVEACNELTAEEKKHIVLIPEPCAKNTAPAIACAVAYVNATSGVERTMLVLTSDHVIKPFAAFKKSANAAASFAQQKKLAIFGITPTKPETGYGYIEVGAELQADVFKVASFREKPSRNAAEFFVESKRFYWNSGMFAFASDFMHEEFCHLAPDVIAPFEHLRKPDKTAYERKKGIKILSNWKGLDKAYRLTESISFDYAIAEQCAQAIMVRSNFDWLDAGSWEEYSLLRGGKVSDFYFSGEGSKGTSSFVDSDIPVAIIGLEDLVVVIRSGKDGAPSAALIAKKGETQRVKDIVEQIKKDGKTELL